MISGSCSKCVLTNDKRLCRNPYGLSPAFCCTQRYKPVLDKAHIEYMHDEIRHFAVEASKQERACYEHLDDTPLITIPRKPRIVEIIEFCHRMNYKRLGFAFCGGLDTEAAVVGELLESQGFEVISVMCKVGGVDKCEIGLEETDKINPGRHESMCNPIGQAMILNDADTEFNILMGLCVGHDSLFHRYSKALCTTFAVKDRVLGHNPLAAIYTQQSYYKYINNLNK